MLNETYHQQMQDYVRELNQLYQKYDALFVKDYDPSGFEWMSCMDADHSTVSFVRRGNSTKDQLLFVCNFTPVQRDQFRVGVPCAGKYEKILSSDELRFGGIGVENSKQVKAQPVMHDGREYSIQMNLPPLSVTVYRFDYR